LTVEQQITGQESWGGLQLQAFPLNLEAFANEKMEPNLSRRWRALVNPMPLDADFPEPPRIYKVSNYQDANSIVEEGLGAGGRMKQEIKADSRGTEAWETSTRCRCFVHLCAADDWQRIIGTPPPHASPTAQDYDNAGLPWFDYKDGKPAVAGSTPLTEIKSISALIEKKTGLKVPDNETIVPKNIIGIKSRSMRAVREF